MSRVIQSPVKKWPGTVTLQQPIAHPAYLAWKNAVADALADHPPTEGGAFSVEFEAALLPGICACVEAWNLEGLGHLTPDTFPATPRAASLRLLSWLIDEIRREIEDADDLPNA